MHRGIATDENDGVRQSGLSHMSVACMLAEAWTFECSV